MPTAYLPSGGVWAADSSCLQDRRVLDQGTLDFEGPDAVAAGGKGKAERGRAAGLPSGVATDRYQPRGDDDVITPPHEPDVSILIHASSVSSDVEVATDCGSCFHWIILGSKHRLDVVSTEKP